MKKCIARNLFASILLIAISGCSGYDRVLFATKTNVGLDIDTTPPTAEVTISRKEIAIEPVFPDGNSLTLFKSNNIKNTDIFIALLQGNTPLSQYIWSKFDDKYKKDLNNKNLSLTDRNLVLVFSLNKIVTDNNCIYNPELFSGIVLRPETQSLLIKHPKDGPDIVIANKLLIEDAYPDQIIKTSSGPRNETTLPLLAAFSYQGLFFDPSITAHFAGGDAAILLAKSIINDNETVESGICLDRAPDDIRSPIKKFGHWLARKLGISDTTPEQDKVAAYNEPRPFYFATDTSFGLKVAWSGTGGSYPDSLKLGYNRKEFASPPVFVREGCNSNDKRYEVKIPSFLASISNESNIISYNNSKLMHVQFIATGSAATEFSRRSSVRRSTFAKIAPDASIIEKGDLNNEFLNKIKELFEKARNSGNFTKTKSMITLAQTMNLVPNNIDPGDSSNSNLDKFIPALKNNVDMPSYAITTNLYYLMKNSTD